ncbi:MAG: SDR family oxidoreductase [Lautropia sp.]|nr:SDR family oxidoreductase [Lautropia sp.]
MNTLAPAKPAATDAQPTPGTAPRVALVTGAGKRLGRAIALALAADGWDVGVHYRHSAQEAAQTVADIEALGRRAVALPARLDVADECNSLIARLSAALGPVSGLVNCASHFDHDDISTFTPEQLDEHIRPNLLAPLLLSQAFFRQWQDAAPLPAQGVIVNLLDQKLFNLNPDFLSYTLTKAALASATVMLAQAMAPQVRVVGVAPGLTLPSYLQTETEFAQAHRTLSPLGASSTPDDVAATVVFAMRTRSVTGTTLLVDGGQHLLGLPRDASLMPLQPRP